MSRENAVESTDIESVEEIDERKGTWRGVSKFFVILFAILCALFLFATLLCAVFVADAKGNPEKNPSLFGIMPIAITSSDQTGGNQTGAMPGSVTLVNKTIKPDRYNVGDRIAFKRDGNIIVGKITQKVGDANGEPYYIAWAGTYDNTYEVRASKEVILGKATHYIPYLGRFSEFVNTPQGMAVCLGIPLVIILALIIIEIYLAIRGRRRFYANGPVVVKKGGYWGWGVLGLGLLGYAAIKYGTSAGWKRNCCTECKPKRRKPANTRKTRIPGGKKRKAIVQFKGKRGKKVNAIIIAKGKKRLI